MPDLSIPAQGMAQAESRVNLAATRISRAASPPGAQDTLDLSAEMVALMQSKNDFAANVQVARTLDRINGSLLDILA